MCDREHQYRSVREDDGDRIPRRGPGRSICDWSRHETGGFRLTRRTSRVRRGAASCPTVQAALTYFTPYHTAFPRLCPPLNLSPLSLSPLSRGFPGSIWYTDA